MHNCKFIKGTDARNHIVRCECGWAYSGTYIEIRERAQHHIAEDSDLRWGDARREHQKDKPFYRRAA